jgi:hypothetical protein
VSDLDDSHLFHAAEVLTEESMRRAVTGDVVNVRLFLLYFICFFECVMMLCYGGCM